MSCRTWLDHEWGPERLVSSDRVIASAPLRGQVLTMEQRCDHCGKVRRTRTPARQTSAYTPIDGGVYGR